MHKTVQNLIDIKNEIEEKINELNFLNYNPEIIAVSKTFSIEKIQPLLQYGHIHFGENKVQEANEKWTHIKKKNKLIKLHMIGKLQTNKVKEAIKIFDFIHSVDSEKLAKKISNEQIKLGLKRKILIQINIGNEDQKSGINLENFKDFYNFCKAIDLDVIGTMCIPPLNDDVSKYFLKMKDLNLKNNLKELSMGMSLDYLVALKFKSTFFRIGTKIFGNRN
tara:strand:+ start:1112 stop:1774 length:663 start_codon:yes stop_codon:yes gene_type:complete